MTRGTSSRPAGDEAEPNAGDPMHGRWIWGLALACFVLAASTGAYYRFSLVTPLPGVLENIRHAHSHLMFFSWVTPALILLLGAALARRGTRPRGFALAALAAAVGGLTTYLPFLKSGYHLTPFAGKLLPISMLASGANGLVWYLFVALYLVATWRLKRDAPLRLFDVAVALLVASTISIGALAFFGASGQIVRPVMLALVDWFLTLFADGWFGLAILGLAALHVAPDRLARRPVGAPAWLLGVAMTVRGVGRYADDALGSAWGAGLEGVGAAVAALGWLVLVGALWPVDRAAAGRQAPSGAALLLRQLSLALLGVKGVVELIGALPAANAWMSAPPVRILFLHAFLLGAVSFALVAAMRTALGPGAFRGAVAFTLAVGLMVAALLPFTVLWPTAWAGAWVLRAAAYTSLAPILVALQALFRLDLGSATRAGSLPAEARTTGPLTP